MRYYEGVISHLPVFRLYLTPLPLASVWRRFLSLLTEISLLPHDTFVHTSVSTGPSRRNRHAGCKTQSPLAICSRDFVNSESDAFSARLQIQKRRG
jgi:hypothetical protein